MSLDAELRAALRAEDWPLFARLRRRRGDKVTTLVWVTKTKVEIPVAEMATGHIENALDLMVNWRENWLTARMEEAMFEELEARIQ